MVAHGTALAFAATSHGLPLLQALKQDPLQDKLFLRDQKKHAMMTPSTW
jgi:hypothetical protein